MMLGVIAKVHACFAQAGAAGAVSTPKLGSIKELCCSAFIESGHHFQKASIQKTTLNLDLRFSMDFEAEGITF